MEGFDEPYWDLVQMLAWVAWRNPEQLGCGQLSVWIKIESSTRPGIFEETVWFKWVGARETDATCSKAETRLLTALRSGEIHASGLKDDSEDRQMIPAVLWADLDFQFRRPWGAFAGPLPDRRRAGTVWTRLRFLREAALALWPSSSGVGTKVERSLESSRATGKDRLRANDAITTEVSAKLGRRPEQLERAKRVLGELYPNGVPLDEKRAAIKEAVNGLLANQRQPPVSIDTIDRALGRRKR